MALVYAKTVTYKTYKRELLSVVVGALTLFLALSLLSYNPQDTSYFYYTSAGASHTNWCGCIGATVSAFLFYLFGAASYGVLILGAYSTHSLYQHHVYVKEWDRLTALIMLLCVSAALSTQHGVDASLSPYPGGFVGYALYDVVYSYFDAIGAALLLYTALAVCLIIILRISGILMIMRVCQNIGARMLYGRSIAGTLRCVYDRIVRICYALKKSWSFVWSLWMRWFGSKPELLPYELETSVQAIHTDSFWQQVCQTRAQESQPAVQRASSNSASLPEETLLSASPISYQLPDLSLFAATKPESHNNQVVQELEKRARALEQKLERFGISGKVVAINHGPVVTLFEYKPAIDSKISKIIALEDDLALALQALSIRIIAPIPGRAVVGFEVANEQRKKVLFADSIRSVEFNHGKKLLPLILGQDTLGNHRIVDLATMPHLLVAGSTGSGKSVALNAMLVSLLCKKMPHELALILIDPKRLEFAAYADIPHLLVPIVTNPKQAPPILQWVVTEMEQRYTSMAARGARTIADYNAMVDRAEQKPMIVVVIDELADLMMHVGREIETLIARIAQMARAAGIHMIVATQRPSVDVITGLIKVNFPSRISFRVTSKIDSRTILDCAGADKLLGKGDMLFLDATDSTLQRIHGAYVTDEEIKTLMLQLKKQASPRYLDLNQLAMQAHEIHDIEDALYNEVLLFLQEIDEVSISLLQRRFRIGYNRSARIIELLESKGLILPSNGSKTRKVVR